MLQCGFDDLRSQDKVPQSKLSVLFAAEAVQFLLRYFKSFMRYNATDPNLMTTARSYAAGSLPSADGVRYAEFLAEFPQLKDERVLQLIEQVMWSRREIAHGQAGRANAEQLKCEIVAALETAGDVYARAMQVVVKLVQVLMRTLEAADCIATNSPRGGKDFVVS